MKQAEYKASRNEAKRCIARVQAEVMKKQAAETLDSKEGRQNIFRPASTFSLELFLLPSFHVLVA